MHSDELAGCFAIVATGLPRFGMHRLRWPEGDLCDCRSEWEISSRSKHLWPRTTDHGPLGRHLLRHRSSTVISTMPAGHDIDAQGVVSQQLRRSDRSGNDSLARTSGPFPSVGAV